MTAPLPARSKAGRRRRRRVRTKALVLLAVGASLALLIGRGTGQVLAQFSCSGHPVYIDVAVSTDLAPAVQRVAQVFNRQQHTVSGRCLSVQVNPGSPAVQAAQIDGQHPVPGQRIDAWIPDSSLWVDQARRFGPGAQTVQPSGSSIAQSPLMLVMPAAAARRTAAFRRANWRLLLPASAGGPPASAGVQVDLPDPTQNAAGLAALIEVSRVLGGGQVGTVNFTRFAYASSITPYFDDPNSLASFVSLAAPPLDGTPVTVTSEQAVLAYDQANRTQPLAARYPTGVGSAFGSPELDYPYVLVTANPLRLAAAGLFREALLRPFATSVIRYSGFRSAAGVPDVVPPRFGLDAQLLQIAPPPSPTQAPTALQAWNRLVLASRNLALIDVSAAMNKPTGVARLNLEHEVGEVASLGLRFFPDSTNMGLWSFPGSPGQARPYQQLVKVGSLSANTGVISRRDQLERINASLQATSQTSVALYGSILDAYKYMRKTYSPKFVNTVLVLTSGVESATGDISASALIKTLRRLNNSTRKVAIVMIVFGNPPNYGQLRQIATSTGGQAYQITNPSQVGPTQVGQVFFQAVAHRLCNPNCVKA